MDQNEKKVEHHFLNILPDLTTVEGELMKLLNDFNNTKLKKYGLFDVSLRQGYRGI
jgi:hypothetical protein